MLNYTSFLFAKVSCYSIIESAVAYLANERLTALDAKQTSQLCTAIKNAFSTILKFLNDMSIHLKGKGCLLMPIGMSGTAPVNYIV